MKFNGIVLLSDKMYCLFMHARKHIIAKRIRIFRQPTKQSEILAHRCFIWSERSLESCLRRCRFMRLFSLGVYMPSKIHPLYHS